MKSTVQSFGIRLQNYATLFVRHQYIALYRWHEDDVKVRSQSVSKRIENQRSWLVIDFLPDLNILQ